MFIGADILCVYEKKKMMKNVTKYISHISTIPNKYKHMGPLIYIVFSSFGLQRKGFLRRIVTGDKKLVHYQKDPFFNSILKVVVAVHIILYIAANG